MGVEPALRAEIINNINVLLHGKDHITLLEAGCGTNSYFCLTSVKHVTGIDISQERLDANSYIQIKILGDIQTYPLPVTQYDVVVCWDVLEHVPRPNDALVNLFKAVKPEGLLVLGFPNILSFKGMITKLTPLWFHRYIYKCLGYTSLPCPTYMRVSMRPKNVIRLAENSGLKVEYCKLLESPTLRRVGARFRIVNWIIAATRVIGRCILLSNESCLYNDYCCLILKKQEV